MREKRQRKKRKEMGRREGEERKGLITPAKKTFKCLWAPVPGNKRPLTFV